VQPVFQGLVDELLHWAGRMRLAGTDEDRKSIGWLFASKAIVQLFVSPFAGPIIDRLGYERPLIVGLSFLDDLRAKPDARRGRRNRSPRQNRSSRVLFCSLAVLDPRVGHTMSVLSPFISVLCHSD